MREKGASHQIWGSASGRSLGRGSFGCRSWGQATAAAAAIGAFADALQAWARAVGSAFVGWAMTQAQTDADLGMAGAIAQAAAADHSAALADAARWPSSSTWAVRDAVHVVAGPS